MAHAYESTRTEAAARPAAIGDLINQVKTDVLELVHNEIALAKAELVPQAKFGGMGAGLFLGAGYFALNGLSLLFLSGALGIARLFNAPTGGVALGFLIMAVLVFVVAGVLALIGLVFVKKVKGPKRTVAQAQASIETIKDAVTRATADVKTQELERKTFRHPETVDPNLRNPGELR
ncbi:phage holin family protein [Granulicoccus sp. GXG6511]|uniref:phage holin family protein n=1 Tax=Granulicoccus sp. GXG6511 TaxID=3381351 RepID=UPI003D7CB36B